MSLFVESIGFGLVTAAVLALASVGFTLQFAVTNVLNLAYGGVMIVSAYAAYAVNERGVSIWISALAGIAAGALLSVILNNFIYTPLPETGDVPDRDGDRVARHDAHPGVRHPGAGRTDQRVLPR